MLLLASLVFVCSFRTASTTPSVSICNDDFTPFDPRIPFFLGGTPEAQQEHIYSERQEHARHTAQGDGLYQATTGTQASFTIRTIGIDGAPTNGNWNTAASETFLYVWIAGEDQIFIAEVVNNGDGTLTAAYQSDFPGSYLVYIEEVQPGKHDEGRPIEGSPFSLTITGDRTLDVAALPVCTAGVEDTRKSFWKPGTWVSSNVASATHGVTRDGWVFQPKMCVHDTFSYDDIMLLAGMEEQTWLVVLGGSIQRGLFLTLVDMALAQGQKDDLADSALQKCWGYANVQIGNLRLTYQEQWASNVCIGEKRGVNHMETELRRVFLGLVDMRLYTLNDREDDVVCNDEKLASGGTASFTCASETFLDATLFKDEAPWPTVILAPAHLSDDDADPNLAIEVLIKALPTTWKGTLLLVEHMAGFTFHWKQANPTRTALKDVGMAYHRKAPNADNGLGRMESYRGGDPRVVFMSSFPMYQAKLFENQSTRDGIRKYAASVHYHYVTGVDSPGSYSGHRIVFSTMTEMLAHIVIGKAVGTKAGMYAAALNTPHIGKHSAAVRRSFEICTDCPASLLPFHVKGVPEPECETVTSLPGGATMGPVWDHTLCPDWCMNMDPIDQKRTESGMVDVRKCPAKYGKP